jgi:hypothetical protein
MCSPCNGETQCPDHKVRHEELFDAEEDLVAIRSKDEFCSDQSFFDQSYLIKYPGIPLHCKNVREIFSITSAIILIFMKIASFAEKADTKHMQKLLLNLWKM